MLKLNDLLRHRRALDGWLLLPHNRIPTATRPMTVCIAAICSPGMIFGASDRMRTSGDIEFENSQKKIWGLTSSIAVMTSGDSGLSTEILERVQEIVDERVQLEPENWWRVEDVVRLYINCYNLARSIRIQETLLAPFGLTGQTFLSQQKQMSDAFVQNLSRDILNYPMPDVAVIITGFDETGPHVFTVHGAYSQCHDGIGFAAIGIGARHAQSQFMLASHAPNSPLPETLFLTYLAKKRSEVAPGVGVGTDMFAIGPGLGRFQWLDKLFDLERLEAIRVKMDVAERSAFTEAGKDINDYIAEFLKQNQAPQASSEDSPEEPNK